MNAEKQLIKLVNFIETESQKQYLLDNTVGQIYDNNQGEIFNDYDHNKASGIQSHAEGTNTEALGDYTHAEGQRTRAQGDNSHAEGADTISSGECSHVEGQQNESSGNCSHGEGVGNKAIGDYSHVEGQNNQAQGMGTHVEGSNNKAEGDYSHVEGSNNLAQGQCSHVEGSNNRAEGRCSHAGGEGTVASTNHQFAIGKYNLPHNDSEGILFAIGNGADDDRRSDALTVNDKGELQVKDIYWFLDSPTGQKTSVKQSLNTLYEVLSISDSNNQLADIKQLVSDLNKITTALEQINATDIHFKQITRSSLRIQVNKITGGNNQ